MRTECCHLVETQDSLELGHLQVHAVTRYYASARRTCIEIMKCPPKMKAVSSGSRIWSRGGPIGQGGPTLKREGFMPDFI